MSVDGLRFLQNPGTAYRYVPSLKPVCANQLAITEWHGVELFMVQQGSKKFGLALLVDKSILGVGGLALFLGPGQVADSVAVAIRNGHATDNCW